MKKTIFEGMATAIVTPMTADGIDYEALGRFIDFQIESGINAIVVMGTNGENATIEYADQKEIIRYTVERVNHRIPVIAGTGTNNTDHVLHNSKNACEVGADAILVVTPYYNKATQNGLYTHFKTAAQMQCDLLPLINALFSEVNPIPAKAAVSAMGFGEENLRLPLTPMEDSTRAVLFEEMRKLGIKV